MQQNKRDYTHYAFITALLLVAVMLGISQIPAFELGGLFFKKINILSEVLPNAKDSTHLFANETGGTIELDSALLEQNDSLMAAVLETPIEEQDSTLTTSTEWNISRSERPLAIVSQPDPELASDTSSLVLIEEFGEENPSMGAFYRALEQLKSGERNRPVRIAVLGDSFIEGDIFTVDLREQLQNIYGGSGVGFIPFATPMAGFRQSVKHTYDNWTVANMKDRKGAYQDRFYISGFLGIPQEGATVKVEGVDFRKHIRQVSVAKLLFTSEQQTKITVTINDTITKTFLTEPHSEIQELVIHAPIQKMRLKLTQTAGFYGYGIILEDRYGVSVDNYSIRGNSGLALFGSNSSVNHQIGKMAGYDLIILEYGLNVIESSVLHYNSYADKLAQIIRYMQRCFPESSILVMGVGDRCENRDGAIRTMPAVHGMIRAQRKAAQETGVAFWNTFNAMGGENSMLTYVKNRWATIDYTHIRYPGGKQIAKQLTKALMQGTTKGEKENYRIDPADSVLRMISNGSATPLIPLATSPAPMASVSEMGNTASARETASARRTQTTTATGQTEPTSSSPTAATVEQTGTTTRSQSASSVEQTRISSEAQPTGSAEPSATPTATAPEPTAPARSAQTAASAEPTPTPTQTVADTTRAKPDTNRVE